MKFMRYGKPFIRVVVVSALFALNSILYAQSDSQVEETSFGEFLYSEASEATLTELLALLDREDPTIGIFSHALSMGVPIDEMLDAAVRHKKDHGRDYYVSAAFLLPLLDFSARKRFSTYELDDLEDPNSATEVIQRFFDSEETLETTPDWHLGEAHMQVGVAELKDIVSQYSKDFWYRKDQDSQPADPSRPVFIQLYTDNESAIINDVDRINQLHQQNPDATLPVVFVFNTVLERPVSRMTQPVTVKSVVADYYANNLMVTPTPEWELREFHTLAKVEELYEVFNIPEQDDIEEERWAAAVADVQRNGIKDSFIVTVLPSGSAGGSGGTLGTLGSGLEVLGDGVVINRVDRIAAAKHLGYTELPVVFYYVDNQRVKPYRLGIRRLGYVAMQAGLSPSQVGFSGAGVPGDGVPTGGNGGFGPPPPPPPTPPRPPRPPQPPEPPACPSPPCQN